MKKPKCYMCGNAEEEPYYIFREGHLYHMSCYIDIDWSINKDKYEKINTKKLMRILAEKLTYSDREEYNNNPNYINALIGKFYKELKVDPEVLRTALDTILNL